MILFTVEKHTSISIAANGNLPLRHYFMTAIQINADGTVQSLWKLSDDICDNEGSSFVFPCSTSVGLFQYDASAKYVTSESRI